MAVRARLKFNGHMPWALESKLINKLGFRVQSRNGKEWLIVEKVDDRKPIPFEVLINGRLPEDVQNQLLKRFNNILNQFAHPEEHLGVIKMRIENIIRTLPKHQAKFAEEWVERNLKEDQ